MKSLTIELPGLGLTLKPKIAEQKFSLLMMQIILPGAEYRALLKRVQVEHVFPSEVEGISRFVDKVRAVADPEQDSPIASDRDALLNTIVADAITIGFKEKNDREQFIQSFIKDTYGKDDISELSFDELRSMCVGLRDRAKNKAVEEVMLDPVLGRYDEPEYESNLAIELCKYFPSLKQGGYLSCDPGCINLDVEDISAIVLALLTEFLKDMFGAAQEKVEKEEKVEVKVEEKKVEEKTIAPRMGISPSEPTDEEIILAYRSQIAKQVQSAPVIPQMYPPSLKAMAQSNMDDPFEV